MYYIKKDYTQKLRDYLLTTPDMDIVEDPQIYVDNYDPNKIQGFLVWNHSAYIAKEYEFADTVRVDFFIIPVFANLGPEGTCSGIQHVALNIDIHRDLAPTTQLFDMITQNIKDWHHSLLTSGICPITVAEQNFIYMIIPNGITKITHLTDAPYSRIGILYKLDYLRKGN